MSFAAKVNRIFVVSRQPSSAGSIISSTLLRKSDAANRNLVPMYLLNSTQVTLPRIFWPLPEIGDSCLK